MRMPETSASCMASSLPLARTQARMRWEEKMSAIADTAALWKRHQ
jgi:hypothetical protein